MLSVAKFWESQELERKIQAVCKEADSSCDIIRGISHEKVTTFARCCFRKSPSIDCPERIIVKISNGKWIESVTFRLQDDYLSIVKNYGNPVHSIKKRHVFRDRHRDIEQTLFEGIVRKEKLPEQLSVINETPCKLKINGYEILSQETRMIPSADTFNVLLKVQRLDWIKAKMPSTLIFENEKALQANMRAVVDSILPCQTHCYSQLQSCERPIECAGATRAFFNVLIRKDQLSLQQTWICLRR